MDNDLVAGETSTYPQTGSDATAPRKPALWGFWPTVGLSAVIAAAVLIVQVAITFSVVAAAKINKPGINFKSFTHSLISNGLFTSVSLLATAPVVIGLTYLFIRLKKGAAVREYLGFHSFKWMGLLKWVIVLLLFLTIESLLAHYLKRPVSDFMINTYKSAYFAPLIWLVFVGTTPLYEEIFFRGFLFKGLLYSRLGPLGSIIITSLVWALLHTQYDIYHISVIFATGLLFGYARLKSGSIYPPLAMHSLMNLLGTIAIAAYLQKTS